MAAVSERLGEPLVRLVRGVEDADGLDGVVDLLRSVADPLVADPERKAALQGHWLGHGIHPLMTDLPLGMWMSGTLLDLVGPPGSRAASRRLIGLGVLAALPTSLTGLAEWASIGARQEQRTGALHAVVNSAALAAYTGSWLARRGGGRRTGTALALLGGLLATSGGYLGGHLTEVRKVSSRHPAFDEGR